VVDWEFFRIGNDYYLVSAAAATASASSSSSMSLASQASRARVAGGSTVYRLDKVRKQFDVYQHITTRRSVAPSRWRHKAQSGLYWHNSMLIL